MHRTTNGFTLPELLVTMTILTMLVVLMANLINGASHLISASSKRSESAKQARRLLDRMAVDFDQIVRRSDLDYYLKTSGNSQPGNDQIAFYSQVPGYYPSTGSQGPVSVVSYRVN